MAPVTTVLSTFDYLVFGGTGDLSLRKLLPSLYLRDKAGQFTPESRIIGISRSHLDTGEYRAKAEEALHLYLPAHEFDAAAWSRFRDRLSYAYVDATSDDGWGDLAGHLDGRDDVIRVFYLATSPSLFGPISERLRASGLVTPKSRVVLEKPIGHDLESARRINDEVGGVFAEEQIYRIDHYLGKETVQNLLALRFANSLFEPLWNAGHIDHVQITVAETVGVESRGGYYDTSGALRDMVQNHLMQLVCLVGMEPPVSLDKEAVRDEKIKVLRSLEPHRHREHRDHHGARPVPGGRRRRRRGAGLSGGGGDRLRQQHRNLRRPQGRGPQLALGRACRSICGPASGCRRRCRRSSSSSARSRTRSSPAEAGETTPNRLVVRLQPDEAIGLHLIAKEPGPGGMRLREVPLNLSFARDLQEPLSRRL